MGRERSWLFVFQVYKHHITVAAVVMAAVPGDPTFPALFPTQNGVLGGRLRVNHVPDTWDLKPVDGKLPQPKGLANSNTEKDVPFRGVCYRNVALHTLLNTPLFVNWLSGHDCIDCPIRDCLTCAFQELALEYWSESPG